MNRVLLAAIAAIAITSINAAEVRRMTLTEAVNLAIAQNRSLKIARLRVAEQQEKKNIEHSSYFPVLSNQSNILRITDLQNIVIPAGAFGTAAGSYVPNQSVALGQGEKTLYSTGTQLTQPLTQLIRIRQANVIAAAEVASSKDELKKAETQVALKVHTLYYGILITRLQKAAAERQVRYAAEHLRESEDSIRNGSALRVSAIEGQANVLETRQAVLTAELQLSDLQTELNDTLGLPLGTQLDLESQVPFNFEQRPREAYLREALSENPEIRSAEQTVLKGRAAVSASRSTYIPDVTAYARQSAQHGVPFLVSNFGTFGVLLNWDVFDFGKRQATIRQRRAQLAQAEENLERLKDEVAVAIDRNYNKVQRAQSLVGVADEVVALRRESERLAMNQANEGIVLVSENTRAGAALLKAEAELLQAKLGFLLAWAELEQSVGRTPGL